MKKMVRLLSVVMLIAMCFSLMSVGASAAGPVVINPGSSSSGSSSANSNGGFSYGTDPFTQAAIADGTAVPGETIITEPDGRQVSDGRDPSRIVEDVPAAVSDEVWKLVERYKGDTNINNESNPYYFVWLMNKFVNGEIDYSNPDSELYTARALFAGFIDEAATNLATAAATQQVLGENEEMQEAVEAVNDMNTDATLEQEVLAEEAEEKIVEVAEEIVSDIKNIDNGPGYSGSSAKGKAVFSFQTAVFTGNSPVVVKTAADLHDVIVANGSITYTGTQELDSSYTGDIVFDFKNCTISGTPGTPIVRVKSGLFKFKNGIINNDFIEVTGGSVILDNMKINVPSGGSNAIKATGGYIDINRSNYITSESASTVVYASGSGTNMIFDGCINTKTATCGIQIAGGAKVTKNAGDINEGSPAADITAPTGVKVVAGTFVFNGGSITGIGKPSTPHSDSTGAAITGTNDGTVKVSINGGTTGSILSSYNAAVYFKDGNGSTPTAIATVADKTVLKDADGFKSDIDKNPTVATVNGVGYDTLQKAVDSADARTHPVEIVNSIEITGAAITIDEDTVINGNGHTLFRNGNIFSISAGNVVLNNITLDSKDAAANTIEVSGGNVTLNDVTVDNCGKACLDNSGGTVEIDGFNCEESGATTIGISATAGNTTVYNMTTKSQQPVESGKGDGVTVFQATCKAPAADTTLELFKADTANGEITKHVGPGSSDALTGGTYYITAREVTVKIKSGGAEDGSYLLYDKSSDENVLQLESTDAVKSVTAYGEDGTPYPINFTPSADYKTITLNDANLANLKAGKYTVSVKFQNSGAVKIPLYVSPEMNTETGEEADTDLYLTKYDKDKKLWQYDAQSHENGWVKINSEDKPLHVGLGPDRDNVIWISDECIPESPDANGDYQVTLLHDDLDHLGNGTNYVWLDYGSYWIPVKFEVYNAAATISPTTTDWNKIDGDKVFTVWPDVLTVKINGQSLESDKEYTYKDGKLTIKASFLKKLPNGSYVMEVSTSKGGVYVDLSVGEVLRPKDIDYHVYGGNKGITFVGSNKIDYTKGLWIGKQNPTQIPPEYYTINSDNTFTLSAAYLNRFTTLGTYYISAYVGDQYCTTTFRIISASQAKYNPSTGDNSQIGMWLIILVLAAVVILVILIPTLKKKKVAPESEKEPEKEEGKEEEK